MHITKYILLSVLFLVQINLYGQTFIKGVIKDQEGETLVGANVYFKSTPFIGTTSDVEGNFTLNIDNLTDTLIISYITYITRSIPLSQIDYGKVLIISLEENSESLDEIVIVGRDPISERFAVKKLNRLDIYFNPLSKGDPLKAINILPSSTNTDESANPTLRGGRQIGLGCI